jgi:hypothetical protein
MKVFVRMSKKFSINTKSAEARARKDTAKQAKERVKQQKLEDEYWRDDDKHVQKKTTKKSISKNKFLLFDLNLNFISG